MLVVEEYRDQVEEEDEEEEEGGGDVKGDVEGVGVDEEGVDEEGVEEEERKEEEEETGDLLSVLISSCNCVPVFFNSLIFFFNSCNNSFIFWSK